MATRNEEVSKNRLPAGSIWNVGVLSALTRFAIVVPVCRFFIVNNVSFSVGSKIGRFDVSQSS